MTTPQKSTIRSADGTGISVLKVGAGEPLIVVGGVLSTAANYVALAQALAARFEVHIVDRRGRGDSGAMGAAYSIHKETQDLLAVLARTGATRVFGHSYGGLIALETAKHAPELTDLAVYEPGVSIAQHPIPTAWMPVYEAMLAAGDARGAFAYFVQQAGHVPEITRKLPLAFLKGAMRAAIREPRWREMEALLEANLVEHRQIAALDGTIASYEAIAADVLLLGGAKSPTGATAPLRALAEVIPDSRLALLHGLRHNAPDDQAPERVAAAVIAHSDRVTEGQR